MKRKIKILFWISCLEILNSCGVKGMPSPPNDPAPIFNRKTNSEVKAQPVTNLVPIVTSPTPLPTIQQKN